MSDTTPTGVPIEFCLQCGAPTLFLNPDSNYAKCGKEAA